MKNIPYHLTFTIARDFIIPPAIDYSSFVLRHFHPPSVLQLMKLVVKSFSLHKLNMVAGFDDSAPVQYDDSMGIADG
jgi:hypothetical protein